MNRIFIRNDTGERKEFAESGYSVDTTTQHDTQYRGSVHKSFYKAQDGYRIDREPDGIYRDKWGNMWSPESTQS